MREKSRTKARSNSGSKRRALSLSHTATAVEPAEGPQQHQSKPAPSFASAVQTTVEQGTPLPSSQSRIPLSPQQQTVIEWVRAGVGSAFVQARAGSGKTFTLTAAVRQMSGSVALTAFNKKIAEELKYKLSDLPGVRVGTFHSFGFAAWRRVAKNVSVNAQQKDRAMMVAAGVPKPMESAVRRLVSLAKQSVVGLAWAIDDQEIWNQIIDHHSILLNAPATTNDEQMTQDLIAYAIRGLHYAREQGRGLIDFDDMLWLPLVEDVATFQNDWVLVDESQDTNVARRMMAAKMLKPRGRSLWVGDDRQAIYGFAGADASAVQEIVDRFDCQLLPLTVTFRCSKSATRLAQSYVPDITPHESNRDGEVVHVSASTFIESFIKNRGIHLGDAILCRNTRPLVDLAFRLIRNGIGCHVEGRDIGNQLENLVTRWKVDTVQELFARLVEYRMQETERLIKREAEHLIDMLNDRIETIFILADGLSTVEQLVAKINSLFQDTDAREGRNRVTLSTIHRYKGRESDRVFILGWGKYLPSKFARQEWELEQERNLAYVAVTRTRDKLYLVEALD